MSELSALEDYILEQEAYLERLKDKRSELWDREADIENFTASHRLQYMRPGDLEALRIACNREWHRRQKDGES